MSGETADKMITEEKIGKRHYHEFITAQLTELNVEKQVNCDLESVEMRVATFDPVPSVYTCNVDSETKF